MTIIKPYKNLTKTKIRGKILELSEKSQKIVDLIDKIKEDTEDNYQAAINDLDNIRNSILILEKKKMFCL